MPNPTSSAWGDHPILIAVDGGRTPCGEQAGPRSLDRLWAEAVAARRRGDDETEHAMRTTLHRILRPLARRIAIQLGRDIALIREAERCLKRELDIWPISYSLWGFEEHLRQAIAHIDPATRDTVSPRSRHHPDVRVSHPSSAIN